MLPDLMYSKKRKGSCLELTGEVFEKEKNALSKSVIIMLIFKYLLFLHLLESEVQYKISSCMFFSLAFFFFSFFKIAEP